MRSSAVASLLVVAATAFIELLGWNGGHPCWWERGHHNVFAAANGDWGGGGMAAAAPSHPGFPRLRPAAAGCVGCTCGHVRARRCVGSETMPLLPLTLSPPPRLQSAHLGAAARCRHEVSSPLTPYKTRIR